jgi:S-adenosylmethionine:tRNA ribosyltransferase-isomerase
MKTELLNYHLPAELIAQQPSDVRSDSRLLVLQRCSGKASDSKFSQIGDFLTSGDCLVLNDTKVLPARFFAQRGSGGKIVGLFLAETGPGEWQVMLKGARKVKCDEVFHIKDRAKQDFCRAKVLDKQGDGRFVLRLNSDEGVEAILERTGFPPLPPYIKRTDDANQAAADKVRYQTVYARKTGAVAAPTAGLHFTRELIEQLKKAGVGFAYITLHIGEGTFKPVTAKNLEQHQIHSERFSIDAENARLINAARKKGGRIIAVGTTSVRVLETVWDGSKIKTAAGQTALFIKPGYKFRAVDAMITNFHLPKSTLLALVAAFAGMKNIFSAYEHAIKQRYRFYSYGDAMLII